MATAFVLSGGASLGAVQVGMLGAIAERGIAPDLLVGTSAGALNAGYLAGHGAQPDAIAGLGALWRSLRTWQLFRPDPRRAVNTLLGRGTAVFGAQGLHELLDRHLTFSRLEDAGIALQVIATDLLTGEEVALDSGPAAAAILASSAIPGMLPPVTCGERTLVDGGLADNAAISRAVQAGAGTIYVLPCGYPCALTSPPRSALGTLTQAMALLVHQRLLHDITLYASEADLIVLPPPCPLSVNPMDFGHADELIRRAHTEAAKFLAVDGGRREDPAAHIRMHTHATAVTVVSR
ncbi:patatin-like phospholipase family protein [Rhodococcus olei]|uniref:Patatin-like phospholipase family protein n=1 Tax=Rhodococcus olei TaxID=2161675 RepID=A0ABP8PM57_9NOCA